MWCIVIEEGDGTVHVNGPYPDATAASLAVSQVADDYADEGDDVERQTGHLDTKNREQECWAINADSYDAVWVYAVEIEDPVT